MSGGEFSAAIIEANLQPWLHEEVFGMCKACYTDSRVESRDTVSTPVIAWFTS